MLFFMFEEEGQLLWWWRKKDGGRSSNRIFVVLEVINDMLIKFERYVLVFIFYDELLSY